jgi:hypothetical protein
MKENYQAILTDFEKWVKKSGCDEDVSALFAGLIDIEEAVEKIYEEYLPSLMQTVKSDGEDQTDLLIDLWLEFEHIQRHAESGSKNITELRKYIESRS